VRERISCSNGTDYEGASVPRPRAESASSYDAEIRRTSFGIPHIRAADWSSLAFGIGYAYASDNAQSLIDAVLTVRGLRSFYFGPDARGSLLPLTNLQSDLFFRLYFDLGRLETEYAKREPGVASMLAAYASGIHQYLSDGGLTGLDGLYREAILAAPISRTDLYLLLAQRATHTSGCAYAQAILAAHPPCDDDSSHSSTITTGSLHSEPVAASNAIAVGRRHTANGSGVLLGNPHFPWAEPHRLYEMHLTIPGQIDVMGASLPPFPVINIGFNRDVAWTHTVSASRRFAIYELALSRHSPLSYRAGWREHDMTRHDIVVPLPSSGESTEHRQTFYSTGFGFPIALPDNGCIWSQRRAYALFDPSAYRVSMVSQWLQINSARSVVEIDRALCTQRGVIWLNTVAADRSGAVYFGDLTAVPDVSIAACLFGRASPRVRRAARTANVIALKATRPTPWGVRRDGNPSLRRASRMPRTTRDDYVLNCNDSHWLVNAQAPMSRFPRYVGLERTMQGLRTRMAHRELGDALARGAGTLRVDTLKEMIFSNRNLAAAMVLDDLVSFCATSASRPSARLTSIGLAAVGVLSRWSRRDDLDGKGAVLFRLFWRRIRTIDIWQHPFSAKEPLTTPRGLRMSDPTTAQIVVSALEQAAEALLSHSFSLDASLRDTQRIPINGEYLALPGGDGSAGVLNLLEFGELTSDGFSPVDIAGPSYTQVVSWQQGRVVAQAILPTSQSSNPNSCHAWDQTHLFSRTEWITLPFYEEEILSDPDITYQRIRHSTKPGSTYP
jgi:acyl-homoserine-lactone acylase